MAQPVAAPSQLKASQGNSDRLMGACVLAFVIALLGLPTAVALGTSWVEIAGSTHAARQAPSWVQSESVRATTSDGTAVLARVAIDAGNAATRNTLEQEWLQVALLLQNSVASHPHQEVVGTSGFRLLSADMRDRLNGFLASRRVEPVRDVIVQDLVVNQL